MTSASQLAREKAQAAFADRIAQQVDQQRQYEEQEQPALYAGGGRIRPLGAAGPVAPRLIQTSGGLPVGTPVAQSQGLVGAMPRAAGDNGEAVRLLKDELAAVALARGMQVGAVPPVDPGRYPNDLYWDNEAAALYYWQPSTTTEEGQWRSFLGATEELNAYFENATSKTYPIITSCRYRTLVVALFTSGTPTATLSPAPGTILEVGDSLGLVVTGSGELAWTVELRRV